MSNKFYQTDIGRIPIGWEPYRVGDLVSFSGGAQPDKSVFKFRSQEGYIRLIQIRDYKTDKYETYIPAKLVRKSCDENDVMIGRYGPPIFQILRGIKGAYNVALIKAIPSEKVNKDFFYHFIKNENLFALMDALSRRSSGQTGVELPALRAYPLPLPSEKEQTAIANALSDIDALITSLEKLIDKKRAIKTAAMQQLLTGKKRLPPFDISNSRKGTPCYKQTELGEIPEDWEVVTIGDKCNLLTGFPFPSSRYSESGVKLLRGSNVKRGVTDWDDGITQYWPELTSDIRQYELKEKDIVISMDGSLVGRSFAQLGKSDLPAILLQRVARLRSEYVDIDYVKEWVCSNYFTDHCDSVKTVTAIPHISPADIRNFKFLMPPTKEEQKRISESLSDMHTEIDLLSERLNKTQQIKQGMMQELLTGRTRLV